MDWMGMISILKEFDKIIIYVKVLRVVVIALTKDMVQSITIPKGVGTNFDILW